MVLERGSSFAHIHSQVHSQPLVVKREHRHPTACVAFSPESMTRPD